MDGFSSLDVFNALSIVTQAGQTAGTLLDPSNLTGQGAQAYNALLNLGLSPADISIYQNGGGSFSAVLSAQGFDTLMSVLQSYLGDASLHYPYTNGARDQYATDSLHAVWFDSQLTDYVGGNGVYMQFHIDADNPWVGSMWDHLKCVFFKMGC